MLARASAKATYSTGVFLQELAPALLPFEPRQLVKVRAAEQHRLPRLPAYSGATIPRRSRHSAG